MQASTCFPVLKTLQFNCCCCCCRRCLHIQADQINHVSLLWKTPQAQRNGRNNPYCVGNDSFQTTSRGVKRSRQRCVIRLTRIGLPKVFEEEWFQSFADRWTISQEMPKHFFKIDVSLWKLKCLSSVDVLKQETFPFPVATQLSAWKVQKVCTSESSRVGRSILAKTTSENTFTVTPIQHRIHATFHHNSACVHTCRTSSFFCFGKLVELVEIFYQHEYWQ